MTESHQGNTFGQKVVHYTRALSRWIKAGRPVRGEEEVKMLFEGFCVVCEVYEEGGSTCGHCGCKVNTSVIAPLNKVAMATEHCPMEKW